MRTPTKRPTGKAILTACLALLVGACGPGGQLPGQAQAGAVPTPGTLTEALSKCAGAHGTLPGADVSVYQGSINWAQASGSLKWAYAKATEGTGYDDPTFKGNWAAMKKQGVARGAYHFFHPSMSGKAQADHYLAQVGTLSPGDLPPMLDWEVNDGVSRATGEASAQAFINEIHAKTGRATIIYTSPGLWPKMSAKSFGTNPLWVADWLYSTSACPTLPSGWSSWVYWQWTDKGSVPGIGGRVDLDVFNGNGTDLEAEGGICQGPVGNVVGNAGPASGTCGGTPTYTPPAACGALKPGEGLGIGESVTSCDGRFVLTMQKNGNVVLRAHGIALWSTQTKGSNAAYLKMRGTGNLVLLTPKGCPVWASKTSGNAGAYLQVKSNGNLVIYGSSKILWRSGTGVIPPAPTSCGAIPSGDGLGPGDVVSSCGGCFHLKMQADGNLVLSQNGHGVLWSTGTSGQDGYMVSMLPGGNLTLYSKYSCVLWKSGTGGNAGAYASVQDNGNVVIRDAQGNALWKSHTAVCSGGCTCNGGGGGTDGGVTDGGTGGSDGGTGGVTDGGTGGSDGGTGGVTDGGTGGSDGGTGGVTDGGTGGSDGGTIGVADGGTGGSDGGTVGVADGGTGGSDGGTVGLADGGAGGASGAGAAGGCGCSATGGGSPAGLVALLLVGLVLRRRRRGAGAGS